VALRTHISKSFLVRLVLFVLVCPRLVSLGFCRFHDRVSGFSVHRIRFGIESIKGCALGSSIALGFLKLINYFNCETSIITVFDGRIQNIL
jgi:hypothetical protein